jgi:flavin-binding protein dodecin
MADSVYKVIRLVGSSPNSWEEDGKVSAYRALVNLSFKYGGEG